jgi:hypothetical protein
VKTTISNEQLKENKELNEKLEDVMGTMIRAFKAFGGANYLELIASQSDDPDTDYSIRVQKTSGITPAEKCTELEMKIAELKRVLAGTEACLGITGYIKKDSLAHTEIQDVLKKAVQSNG